MYAVAVSFVLAGKLLAFKGLDVVSKLIREMGDDGKKLEFYPILSFLCYLATWLHFRTESKYEVFQAF